MAAKPNIALARWATGSADLLTPSGGLRDTGFVSGTLAEPGYVDYLYNQLYQWAQYLDDGIIDGDLTVDNLHVLGDVDIDDDLNVDGDVQIDLTLNVGGNVTVGGYTDADQHYFTQAQNLKIPACDAVNPGGGHALSTAGSWWVTAGVTAPIAFPVDVPTGAVIGGFTIFLNKSSGASYRAKLLRVTSAFVEDDLGLTPGTQAGTGDQTLSGGAMSVTTDSTSSYFVYIYPNSGSFQASDKIGHCVVSWTYPHP